METPYTPDELKARRAGHKWTQQQAAANLGLTWHGYQDKEAGERHASRQDMELIGYVNRDAAQEKATA